MYYNAHERAARTTHSQFQEKLGRNGLASSEMQVLIRLHDDFQVDIVDEHEHAGVVTSTFVLPHAFQYAVCNATWRRGWAHGGCVITPASGMAGDSPVTTFEFRAPNGDVIALGLDRDEIHDFNKGMTWMHRNRPAGWIDFGNLRGAWLTRTPAPTALPMAA